MKQKLSYTVTRANTLQDIEEAFSCGLAKLYQDVFAEPPYDEYFSNDDVVSIFYPCFTDKTSDSIVLIAYLDKQVIGFCIAFSLDRDRPNFEIITDPDTQASLSFHEYLSKNFTSNPNNLWYLDDLGVRKDLRRRGVATKLLQDCLAELNSKNIFLRTSESSERSQQLYRGFGFDRIDRLYTEVSHQRSDGSFSKDRRIIMLRQALPINYHFSK